MSSDLAFLGVYIGFSLGIFALIRHEITWIAVKWVQNTLIFRAILVTVILSNIVYFLEATKVGSYIDLYIGQNSLSLHFILIAGLLIIIAQFLYIYGCPSVIRNFSGQTEYLAFCMNHFSLDVLQEENRRLNTEFNSIGLYDHDTIYDLANRSAQSDAVGAERLTRYLFINYHYTALNESTHLLVLRLAGYIQILAVLLYFHPAIKRIVFLAWFVMVKVFRQLGWPT